MDYPNRQRVKLWGTAKVVENDAKMLDRLSDPEYPGKVERAIVFTLEAWDTNCHQHIQPRLTQQQIAPIIEKLESRVRELEAELAKLRATSSGL
jgi:predicted pyridoxine 5'-phosphate oxidase superfamily flavin-nucleotide-binding protein